MSERFFTPEQLSVSDEVMIEALKTRGLEDAETKEMMMRWSRAEEEKMNRENTPMVNAMAGIQLVFRQVDIYRRAGHLEAARVALEDAREAAYGMNDDQLIARVEALMDWVESAG